MPNEHPSTDSPGEGRTLTTSEHFLDAGEELTPGQMLDQFRVIGPLGSGGMGVVYEAEDTLLKRRVALKVLRGSAAADDRFRRLLREAQAVARLSHSHVVGIHHIGQRPGGYYLVHELMRGGSLLDRLRKSGAMPWREATRAIADACRGLQAAHAAGLIHRDIKPANLMCDEAGNIKVTDFGLVRGGDFTATTAGSIAGTPDFMSPEQCRSESVDARADLYSLGATYFALLTGKPPYSGDTAMQVMFAHCSNPIPDPRDLKADLPESCVAVIRKALAKAPVERYQSAEEMLSALLSTTDHEEPDRPTKTISSRRIVGRSRQTYVAVVSLIGIALLSVAVGIAAMKWPTSKSSRNGSGGTPQTPGESSSKWGAPIPDEGRVVSLGGKVQVVAFSRDGRMFAAGLGERSQLRDNKAGVTVWEFKSGKVIEECLWPDHIVRSLMFVKDGWGLMVGSAEGAKTWRFRERDILHNVRTTGVETIAQSADGKSYAVGFSSGGSIGQVRRWKYAGDELPQIGGGEQPVRQVVFAPDADRTLAVALDDGAVVIWNSTREGLAASPPTLRQGRPAVLAFMPNRPILAIAVSMSVRFWDTRREAFGAIELKPSNEISAIEFIGEFVDDGEHLAIGHHSGEVTLWRIADGVHVRTFRGHGKRVNSIAFSAEDRVLATGSDDGDVRFWDLRRALASAREGK